MFSNLHRSSGKKIVKVRPHYAARHTVAKCGKAVRQKLRHATSICGRCVGMPFNAARPKNLIGKLLVPSKEVARHLMNKGFQNGISQLEKQIRPSSPISFHSFGNLKKVCKKFFFHVDAIALAACAEQLLPRSKAALCCILPRSIVWTHLNNSSRMSYAIQCRELVLTLLICFKPLYTNMYQTNL